MLVAADDELGHRPRAPGITFGRLTSNPFAYLRLIYRLPVIAVTTAVCLFGRLLGLKNAARAGIRFMSFVCGRELDFSGAAPDPAARLIVANHFSYLDLFPLYCLWPASYAVAGAEIRKFLLFGKYLRRCMIFVDNRDAESRRQTRAEMRRVWAEGGTVVVFPGSRRAGSPPPPPGVLYDANPFRKGSFEEAIAAGLVIQGARISYSAELLSALSGRHFEQSFLWVLCQNFTIRIHLFPAEKATGDAATLARTWEERILRTREEG